MITKFKIFENSGFYTLEQLIKQDDVPERDIKVLDYLKNVKTEKNILDAALYTTCIHYKETELNKYLHIITYLVNAGANPNLKRFNAHTFKNESLLKILLDILINTNFYKKQSIKIILKLIENGAEWMNLNIDNEDLLDKLKNIYPEDYAEHIKKLQIKKFKI